MTINQDKLGELLGRFVGDLGATAAAGNVVVGHRLGLYRALAEGPATAEELARRTGTEPRYVAEWLRGQAAGGYVSCDPAGGRFSLTEEQAFALADPDGALYLPGAFLLALGALRAESQVTDAFRSGAGMGWHEHRPGRGTVPAGRVPARAGRAAGRVAGHRRVPVRRRHGLARAPRGRVLRLRDVLPAWLRCQPHVQLDPGAARRGGKAGGRRPGGRRRLRPRSVDHAAGPGLPRVRDHRLGLPPGVH